ncbi:hypothetical protein E7T06_16830 [Deinococcus sp. Arct2-2]|uniref:hypothetical protein n=1 Tax=Deinococcus sp. Arct2-2 TaxID=2568653 RepID=UPI0010A437FE|nr:hypothetical protein [Deinococcus sp. Arct2-2]THF68329.1 hypothetical protein E7T06_16830 [Deinococcus sp. Arct2-2]
MENLFFDSALKTYGPFLYSAGWLLVTLLLISGAGLCLLLAQKQREVPGGVSWVWRTVAIFLVGAALGVFILKGVNLAQGLITLGVVVLWGAGLLGKTGKPRRGRRRSRYS